jgi:hypothetical protein
MNHFVLTTDPAWIQVSGTGPLALTPADDPSKK